MAAGVRERLGVDVARRRDGRRRARRRHAPRSPSGSSTSTSPAPDGERGAEFELPGDRDAVRSRAAVAALHLAAARPDTESARRRMTSAGSVGGDERLRLFLALELPPPRSTRSSPGGAAHLRGGRVVAAGAPARHARVPRQPPAGGARRDRRALRDAAAAGRSRSRSSPRAGARRRSVGMLVLDDHGRRATRLAAACHARLEALGVYRPEARPWLPHVTVLRFRERPRLRPAAARDGNIRSVRRGCLPIPTAPDRRAVRGAGTRLADRRRMMSMNREEALDVALGQIERQFGKGSVMRMSDAAAGVGRGGLDGLALARPRARHRRPAARTRRRDLRPRVLGQDDARLPRDRRGAASRRDLRVHRRRARDGPDVRAPDRRQHRRAARLAARHRRAGARDRRAPDPLGRASTSSRSTRSRR